MSYLSSTEQQLRELVKSTPKNQLAGDLVSYVIDRVLESYNNGLNTGLARQAKQRKVNKQVTTA